MKSKLICILLILVLVFGCNKSGNDLLGTWVGFWGFGVSEPDEPMTVIFKEKGIARVVYGYSTDTSKASFKTNGTYTFDGLTLKFTYSEGLNSFTHEAIPENNKMEGTWGNTPNSSGSGLFNLEKE